MIHHRDLDPALADELLRVLKRWGLFRASGQGWIAGDEKRLMHNYFGWGWFRRPGSVRLTLTLLVAMIATGAAIVGGAYLWQPPKELTVSVILIWMIMMSVWWTISVFETARVLLAGTLSATLPFLRFDREDDRVYAEAVARLVDHADMPVDEQRRMIGALNEIMRDIRRLESDALELAEGAREDELAHELATLRAQHDQSTDAVAKAEWARALETLQSRLAGVRAQNPEQERVQASLASLRQTLHATRDALQRLSKKPRTSAEAVPDGLRSEILSIQKALDEVQRISIGAEG
jgi:hypothetical protein